MFMLFAWEAIAFTLTRLGSAGISLHKDFPNTSVRSEIKLLVEHAVDTLGLLIAVAMAIEEEGLLYVGEITDSGLQLGFCHVFPLEFTENVVLAPDFAQFELSTPAKLKSTVSLYMIGLLISSKFFGCNDGKSLTPKIRLSLLGPQLLFGGT